MRILTALLVVLSYQTASALFCSVEQNLMVVNAETLKSLQQDFADLGDDSEFMDELAVSAKIITAAGGMNAQGSSLLLSAETSMSLNLVSPDLTLKTDEKLEMEDVIKDHENFKKLQTIINSLPRQSKKIHLKCTRVAGNIECADENNRLIVLDQGQSHLSMFYVNPVRHDRTLLFSNRITCN